MTMIPTMKSNRLNPIDAICPEDAPSTLEGTRGAAVSGRETADRGVSPVIGAILMFGLAFATLAMLQATAIPAMNEQLEFQHNERAQADIVDLNSAIGRSGTLESRETIEVEIGERYPPRMFFINPPPVAGTLRTTESETIVVDNAQSSGEAGDYWNGTPRRFETRSVVYTSNYHEYGNAPITVLEPWAVYNRFDNASQLVTDVGFIDGRRIGVITIVGEVSAAGTQSASITARPASAPVEEVLVQDDDDPIILTLPTRLPQEVWETMLDNELDPGGDPTNDRYVTDLDCQQSPPAPCGELTITLEAGASYELRLGRVAVGSDGPEPTATYLVDIVGDQTSIPEGGSQKLVVEVRDAFDNPVSGVEVNASTDDEGTLRTVRGTSGSDGHASFVYESPENVAETTDTNVTIDIGRGAPPETVVYTVEVMDLGGPKDGERSPTGTITDVSSRFVGNQDRYDVSVDAGDADGDLDRVEFELRNPETGTVIDDVTTPVRGTNDSMTERLSATGENRISEYRIVVTVFDAEGNTGGDETMVSGSG